MHHLSAFSSSIAAGATLATLTAIADQVIQTQNSSIFLMDNRKLLIAQAGGTGMTQALISSPTLLQNGKPAIYPIDRGTEGGLLPAIMAPMLDGLPLPLREQISIQVSSDDAGAQTMYAFLWHTKQFIPKPPGPFKTIPFTLTGAGAAGAWQLGTIALTQGLRSGSYKCVGLAVQGTNLLAARLVFPQQIDRPGCLGNVDASTYTWDFWRNGNAGTFGSFDNDNLPQIELFGTGTLSGTVQGYLDITPNPTF